MIVTETASPQSVNPAGKRSRITAAVAPDYFPQAARLLNSSSTLLFLKWM